jgi:hypothetical protein
MTETIPPGCDDIPDCICVDSNLPAHKDCPYCYPTQPAEPDTRPGRVVAVVAILAVALLLLGWCDDKPWDTGTIRAAATR